MTGESMIDCWTSPSLVHPRKQSCFPGAILMRLHWAIVEENRIQINLAFAGIGLFSKLERFC